MKTTKTQVLRARAMPMQMKMQMQMQMQMQMKAWLVAFAAFVAVSSACQLALAGEKTGEKAGEKTVLEMAVVDTGFEPKAFTVKPGSDVVLKITRKTDITCSTQIQVPSKKIKVDLPLNKTVNVALGKVAKGDIRFGCGMEMMDSGKISVK